MVLPVRVLTKICIPPRRRSTTKNTVRMNSRHNIQSGQRTKVKSGLLLNVVIGKGPTVLKLLSSENEALLIRGDTLLVLDLGLDIIDGIGRLDLEGDGLAREGLDKDLHSNTETTQSAMKQANEYEEQHTVRAG